MTSISNSSLVTNCDIRCGLAPFVCSAFAATGWLNSPKSLLLKSLSARRTQVRSPPPPLTPELQPGSNQNRLGSSFFRALFFAQLLEEFLTRCFLPLQDRGTRPRADFAKRGSKSSIKGSEGRDSRVTSHVNDYQ